MRVNPTVCGQEFLFAEAQAQVSAIDTKSRILYRSNVFNEATGYEKKKPPGQRYNIVRHLKTPAEPYQDLLEPMLNAPLPMRVIEGRLIGIAVDSVSDVVTLSVEQTDTQPKMTGSIRADFVNGIARRPRGEIDQSLLILRDIERLTAANAARAAEPRVA